MCSLYDQLWQPTIIFLLVLSVLTMLLRLHLADKGRKGRADHQHTHWLFALTFWGGGIVGIAMLALMIGGFICVGSPGDMVGMIPN